MKLQVSKTNTPNWREITVKSELPSKLKDLEELSKNLWWVWNSEGKNLFHDIDPDLWRATGENPVLMLQKIDHDRYEEIMNDEAMMARINSVVKSFNNYMSQPMRTDVPSIAYFSMEYGLCACLKIYSGGLGILAGDYIKQASDSRVDMTAVGFLYKHGYFTQTLSVDGQQMANYEPQNFNQLPIEPVLDENGSQIVLEVPYPGRVIYANIWKVNVGRMNLYLLDTDNDKNSEFDRPITSQLYGGDWENRIKQEYMLGIGGVLMLKRLGIKTQLYHCNEGHAALLNLQRLVDYVQEEKLDFNVALELVRSTSLYTVHTPVPAGHDYFDEGLFGKYMGEYPAKLGISWQDLMNMGRENPDTNERFSMSVFALNTCQEANGVSWLHGEVSKKMFQGIWKGYSPEESHVSYVTNGVHMPTWAASEWKEFYTEKLGAQVFEDQSNPEAWDGIFKVADEEIWNMRMTMKNKFINFVKKDFREKWLANQGDPSAVMKIVDKINPNALIIGFARRFATYKRAHLLFRDLDRLAEIVNDPKQPVQFLFAGKAHPADKAGQDLIKMIVEISKQPRFIGKIVFVPNYDITVAKYLVQGVDVWMNNPTRPLEASGTSGEKAAMNGVMHFSVLDGWWVEGYKQGAGWALPMERTYDDQNYQDELDAATIYNIIENEIAPTFYNKSLSTGRSADWIEYIKNCVAQVACNFTTNRMLTDYIDQYYVPQAERVDAVVADDFAQAREIAAWKKRLRREWKNVEVVSVNMPDSNSDNFAIGQAYEAEIVLNIGDLNAEEIGVEVLFATFDKKGKLHIQEKFDFTASEAVDGVAKYTASINPDRSGIYQVAGRIYAKNSKLPHRQDFELVRWL